MRTIAADPVAIENLIETARHDAQVYLRCYEAGWGRPFQAVGLTIEDNRDRYAILLSDGAEISDPATTTTLPKGDLN